MREIKNLDSKDRLGAKQHALADLMREIFQEHLDLQVVEWSDGPSHGTTMENKSVDSTR